MEFSTRKMWLNEYDIEENKFSTVLCLQYQTNGIDHWVYTTEYIYQYLSSKFYKSQDYFYTYIFDIVKNFSGELHNQSCFNLNKVKNIEELIDKLNGFLIMEKLIE